MSTRHLRRSTARLAMALSVNPAPAAQYLTGTVSALGAGAATDGHTLVSVTVGTDDVALPYPDSYSPTVGDVVLVLVTNNSPLILAHLIGIP